MWRLELEYLVGSLGVGSSVELPIPAAPWIDRLDLSSLTFQAHPNDSCPAVEQLACERFGSGVIFALSKDEAC
jgi:hypothetical protein